jgi:glycosyltransferase involved in cell wall biosynthesis
VRLTVATHYDPTDLRIKSGTTAHMVRELRRQCPVTLAGPVDSPLSSVFGRLQNGRRRLPGRLYRGDQEILLARDYARRLAARMDVSTTDAILAPDVIPVAYLETGLPLVIWDDATFHAIRDYYPEYSNLSRRTIRQTETLAQRALERAELAVFASRWAADSAIEHYGADPDRVIVIPFGANLSREPTDADVGDRIHAKPGSPFRLLLVGVDWYRKGVDIAVSAIEVLRRSGTDAVLTVVGCDPPPGVQVPEHVRVLGRLHKARSEDVERFRDLWRESDLFVLPTRAECYGIVMAEAAAYGLPSLGTATGGVPTVIDDGISGVLLSPQATAEDWAGAIEQVLSDEDRYRVMAAAARQKYRRELNWSSAGRRLLDEMADRFGSNVASGGDPD